MAKFIDDITSNPDWQRYHTDPANPNDPRQVLANTAPPPDYLSLLSPENLAKIRTALAPIFAQQEGMLNRQYGNALGGNLRSAGALASSRGYDNAAPLLQRAKTDTFNSFQPSFDNLALQQLQAPLGLVGQQYNSLLNQSNFNMDKIGKLQQEREWDNRPGFWDYLGGGLLGLGGSFLGGGFGQALGTQLGKSWSGGNTEEGDLGKTVTANPWGQLG